MGGMGVAPVGEVGGERAGEEGDVFGCGSGRWWSVRYRGGVGGGDGKGGTYKIPRVSGGVVALVRGRGQAVVSPWMGDQMGNSPWGQRTGVRTVSRPMG